MIEFDQSVGLVPFVRAGALFWPAFAAAGAGAGLSNAQNRFERVPFIPAQAGIQGYVTE
jgi:hypothetical protein